MKPFKPNKRQRKPAKLERLEKELANTLLLVKQYSSRASSSRKPLEKAGLYAALCASQEECSRLRKEIAKVLREREQRKFPTLFD